MPSVVCCTLLPVLQLAAVTKFFSVRQHWFGIPECRSTDFFSEKGNAKQTLFFGGKSRQDEETVATDTKRLFFILGSKFCSNGQFQYQMTTKCDFQMTAWFTIQVRKRKYHLRLSKESSCPDVLSSQHEFKLAKSTREKKCYSIDPKLGKWQMTDVNWQLRSDRSNPTYCHCSPAQVC